MKSLTICLASVALAVTSLGTTSCKQGKSRIENDQPAPAATAAKLTAADCVDPDLSMLASTQTMMLCNGQLAAGTLSVPANCSSDGATGCVTTSSFKSANATTAVAGNIKSGVVIAGVTGTVVATPANCSADGATGCVTTTSYPAANSSNLNPSNISYNVQIGGVTGTKRDIKQCRNGVHLATYDASFYSVLPFSITAGAGTVNIGTGVLTLGVPHGLTTGDAVRLSTGTTFPTGFAAHTTYFVIAASSTTIKLASSSINATAGTAIIPSTVGSGTLTFLSLANSEADVWDTIDNANAGVTSSPALDPWGGSYVCTESNFTDVSNSTASLIPTNATPAGATYNFSEIWQDNLTGLYVTNVLEDDNGSLNWAQVMSMCNNLNSGDGAGEWRLPTQKELMQLYIDGITWVPTAGEGYNSDNGNYYFWSSSANSVNTDYVWFVDLYQGTMNLNYRYSTGQGAFCVR